MSNKIAFYFIYASVLYLRDTIYTWKLRGRGWYRRLRCLLTSIRPDVKIAGYPRGYLAVGLPSYKLAILIYRSYLLHVLSGLRMIGHKYKVMKGHTV